MEIQNKLRLSFYQKLTDINEAHGVQLVQHVESNQIFVLKTLHIYDLRVYLYLKEHPVRGVPHIEELIEDDGTLYVIEEYISGRSLRTILDEDGPLEEEEATRIAEQLCQILQPLHSQNPPIIHRDIKPGNLILQYNGDIALVDFNSAKESNPSRSRDTVLIGTAGYAAPEQYGFRSSRPTADIYAIGVLLNELLTGALPGQQQYKGRLRRVIDNCTKLDPSDRYQSMSALLLGIRTYKMQKLAPEKQPYTPSEPMPPPTPAVPLDSFRSYLPPGFRAKWPAVVPLGIAAGLWYALCFSVGMSMEFEHAAGVQLLLYRIISVLTLLMCTFWFGNYRNVWSLLPLSKSTNPFVRGCGAILWGMALFFLSLIAGLILIAIVSL